MTTEKKQNDKRTSRMMGERGSTTMEER